MQLDILTPDAELFSGEIETVFLPGKAKGEFQILNDHMPLVATLDEGIVKVTTTGTTTAGSIADASELSGAATDPRMSISGIEWSVAATTQILWDATTNVVCFTCNGSGSYGFGDGAPSLANNAGTGITGDVLATHGTSVGTIIVRFRKVSGFDNIT